MAEISTLRLYLLRAGYLLLAVGLALMIWPSILSHGSDVPHMNTAVRSLLGAVGLLAFVGIRYPLKMLPILLFEFVWKTIWIISFGLPLWRQGLLTGDFAETMFNCLSMVIFIPLMPWDYIWKTYIRAPGVLGGRECRVRKSEPLFALSPWIRFRISGKFAKCHDDELPTSTCFSRFSLLVADPKNEKRDLGFWIEDGSPVAVNSTQQHSQVRKGGLAPALRTMQHQATFAMSGGKAALPALRM